MDASSQLMQSGVPKYKMLFIMKTYSSKDIIYALKRLTIVKGEYECLGDSVIYLLNTLQMKRDIKSQIKKIKKMSSEIQRNAL